jgi:hypothetical protein
MSLLDRMAFDQQDECLCQSEDLAQDCMLREPLGQTHAEHFAKSLALALRVLSFVAFLGEGWAWGHFPHTCFQVLQGISIVSLWGQLGIQWVSVVGQWPLSANLLSCPGDVVLDAAPQPL